MAATEYSLATFETIEGTNSGRTQVSDESPLPVQLTNGDGTDVEISVPVVAATLDDIAALLKGILLETRATRLAIQSFVNAGEDWDKADFLEQSKSLDLLDEE